MLFVDLVSSTERASTLGDRQWFTAELDLEVRVGLHMGECEVSADDAFGIAVQVAARMQEHAQPGEVLVSHTMRDLVMGSDDRFEASGIHVLKGVPGKWRLFALQP